MSIKDDIVNDIKDGLNANTVEILFNTGVDIKLAEERYKFLTQPNYYTNDEIEYTPAMIDMEETPTGNPEIDKSEWGITITFALTGQDDEDTYLLTERDAIEQFRKNLKQNPITSYIYDDEIYGAYFKPTHAVRTQEVTDQAGNNIVLYAMSIAVLTGIGLKFGEDEKLDIEKDGEFTVTELFVDSKEIGTSIEYNTSENDTDDTALGVPNRGIFQCRATVLYNDDLLAHRYLYDLAVGAKAFDELMDLTITKPNTGTVDKQVNAQVNIVSNSGLGISLVIVFTEAIN